MFRPVLRPSSGMSLQKPYTGRYIKHFKGPFTLVIFRLRNEKKLVSSCTRLVWVLYSGEVRGEVGTRSRMCYIGWVVWVHGVLLLYVILG